MLKENFEGKVVLLKLISREEIVGVCTSITPDSGLIVKEPYTLVLNKGSIQMIPFMFGSLKAEVGIFPQSLLVAPMLAPSTLEEAYRDSVSPIERPPAGAHASSIFTGK